MAALTVQTAAMAGITLTAQTPAGGGDSFANDGDTVVFFYNQSGSPITVTFDAAGGDEGLTLTDPTCEVPAGGAYVAGPFEMEWFNDANGNVNMTYSAVTSLSVFVLKLN